VRRTPEREQPSSCSRRIQAPRHRLIACVCLFLLWHARTHPSRLFEVGRRCPRLASAASYPSAQQAPTLRPPVPAALKPSLCPLPAAPRPRREPRTCQRVAPPPAALPDVPSINNPPSRPEGGKAPVGALPAARAGAAACPAAAVALRRLTAPPLPCPLGRAFSLPHLPLDSTALRVNGATPIQITQATRCPVGGEPGAQVREPVRGWDQVNQVKRTGFC
jgi:hypothetical protein